MVLPLKIKWDHSDLPERHNIPCLELKNHNSICLRRFKNTNISIYCNFKLKKLRYICSMKKNPYFPYGDKSSRHIKNLEKKNMMQVRELLIN